MIESRRDTQDSVNVDCRCDNSLLKYHHFMAVPMELKIQIINKCYPIPYVRLRRSCRFLDEFCEWNKSLLGIYCYRKDPPLLFTSSLVRSPLYGFPELHMHGNDYFLFVNYEENILDIKYKVEMTRRNVPRIRRSLSGFAFTHATVECSGLEENFGKAFPYFLQIAADLKVKHLTLWQVPPHYTVMLLSIWKLESLYIVVVTDNDMAGYWTLSTVKGIPSISSCVIYSNAEADEKTIVEDARKRKSFHFSAKLSAPIVWRLLQGIYGLDWKNETDTPDTVSFEFTEGRSYLDLDLPKEYAHLVPREAVSLGFTNKVRLLLDNSYRIIYNVWLMKADNNEYWRILSIERSSWFEVVFRVQTARSHEQLVMTLIEFLESCTERTADFSILYKSLIELEAIQEIPQVFNRFIRRVENSYSMPSEGPSDSR